MWPSIFQGFFYICKNSKLYQFVFPFSCCLNNLTCFKCNLSYVVCSRCIAVQWLSCHSSLQTHTCTGHLWGVGVSAIVTIATDTVSCSLVGGSAINGALQTFVVSLCSLEEAWYTSCKRHGEQSKMYKLKKYALLTWQSKTNQISPFLAIGCFNIRTSLHFIFLLSICLVLMGLDLCVS